MDSLVDGVYELHCEFQSPYGGIGGDTVSQSIEGGRNFDWYFSGKKLLQAEPLEAGAPTAKAIIGGLLGIE